MRQQYRQCAGQVGGGAQRHIGKRSRREPPRRAGRSERPRAAELPGRDRLCLKPIARRRRSAGETVIRSATVPIEIRLRADKPGGDGSDLKPDAGAAVASVARVEEDKTCAVERFLNCGERAGTRVGPTPLQVLYSDFGETRRLGELGLRPIEQPASSAYLSPR